MTGEEIMVVAPWLQYLAGGGFAVWAVSNFVTIATKIKANGKHSVAAVKCADNERLVCHIQEVHDTFSSMGRVEACVGVLQSTMLEANGYLKRIAENGSKK